ncbi:MAG TPA: apolipoprotein N-acyltransferase [Chthoniobacteraceae bacterium]
MLLVLCFPPFNQGWLVWVALTPLLCAVWFSSGTKPGLRSLALGYVAGLFFFTGTFYWLGTLAALYENPLLLSLPVLLALVLSSYFAVWTWMLSQLLAPAAIRTFPSSLRNLWIGAAGACVWVALEWTRGWLFGGFGWNGLGVALHRDVAMMQIADITGVWGLTWLVAFINLMAVIVIRRIVGEFGPVFLKRIRWEFSFSVALVVLVFAYGVRALIAGGDKSQLPLRVAAIQPNIPQQEKFDPNFEDRVFATLDRLTGLALLTQPPPQLVIWPEATTPRPMFADAKNYGFVLEQAKRGDFGLLIGTLDSDPVRGEDYNIAALFTEQGQTLQSYRKMHLVPFGEYLPLRPFFAGFLGELVPGDFTAGLEPAILDLKRPALRIGALICFEDTLGDLARRSVAKGAQLLVNITNDGWFATSPAAEQHFANAIFRAIETRRPLVRCGNTGVTGSTDAFGRTVGFESKRPNLRIPGVLPFLKPFQQGFVSGEISVPTSNHLTFYTRFGDWLPIGSSLITGTLLAVALLRSFKARGRSVP